MARDIEEFLKQAAQRRQEKLRQRQQQQQKQQQQVNRPQPTQPVQPQPVRPQPPRPAPQQRNPQQSRRPAQPRSIREPLQQDIRIIEATEAKVPLKQRHVETHIDTSGIADRVERLGDRIEQVDDVVDARLHSKFDHEVGHLRSGENIADDRTFVDTSGEASPLAHSLFNALQTPQSVQQAILLAEILKRPDFE